MKVQQQVVAHALHQQWPNRATLFGKGDMRGPTLVSRERHLWLRVPWSTNKGAPGRIGHIFFDRQGPKQPRSRQSTMSISSLRQACRYAIIGGGLGGLTAARVMQGQGLEVAVFERDASREARRQGGSLDLHPNSGLWALSQAGLEAKFRALARPEGQDMRILDKYGQALWEEVSSPDQPPVMERPEIDRPLLRALLMDSLSEGTMQWGSALTAVEQPLSNNACYTLRFADGSAVTAEVVIGADGARSRVRPLLTEAQPSYCGVSYLELGIPDADRMHPEASALVGQGTTFALSDDKGIMAQRNGDGRIRIYVALRIPANSFESLGIDLGASTDACHAAIVKLFAGWAPQITGLIEACDGICLPWPLYALPAGLRWPSHPCATLLGDAAHLMAPSGEGANLAMQDGAELALELAKADPRAAIAAYEKRMFERSADAAHDSASMLKMMISKDGSAQMAQWMREAHAGLQPE